jgi:ATP-dependent helicase/nuclease subunit B
MKILWSRAGRGGMDALLTELLSKKGERCLWLVPEPYSHAAERLLAERGGASACLYAEVVTFRRLCDHILAEGGGLSLTVLDEGGRLLLMRRALRAVAGQLRALNAFAHKPGFLPSLLETLDECKNYGVLPGDLERAGGDKLQDLSLIFSAYAMLREDGTIDPRDRFTLAWEKAGEIKFGRGAHIFVSGFASFTPQERFLLKRLNDFAASFTTLFRGEFSDAGFAPLRTTARHLSFDSGQRTVDRLEAERHPALAHMERVWFDRRAALFAGDAGGALEAYVASSEAGEARFAAERVLRLARDEGYRWRDIGIVCSALEDYLPLIESIFPLYKIPYFSDKMDDAADKPLSRCINALSDCTRYGFRQDDVMRLLRTGLLPFSLEDCDLMENYLRRWNPRGSRFSGDADWVRPLSGWRKEPSETDIKELKRLNALRRHITNAAKVLSKEKKLSTALELLGVPEGLERQAAALLEAGEGKLASECGQMWELFIKAAEQCSAILDGEQVDCHEFCELCLLVMSGYSVGSIPASLDRVNVGDQGRFPRIPFKVIIYIGVSADRVPARPGGGGLLSLEERAALAGAGCEMPPDPPAKIEREFYNLYTACTLPSQKLILTYTGANNTKDDGRAEIIGKLCGIFDLRPLPVPPPSIPIYQMPPVVNCPLSAANVTALYGKSLRVSASRIEKFSLCPFAYFCRYGLKAEGRPEPGFAPPDVGVEIHAILEGCTRYAMERGGFRSVPREELVYFAEVSAKEGIEKLMRFGNAATPRLLAQGVRLAGAAKLLAGKLWDEFTESKFSPVGFEMFAEGKPSLLSGLPQDAPSSYILRGNADRVDGYRKDGAHYLRVVDYKTGGKTFSLADVYNGIGAQLPLYLFLLCGNGGTPGGMLYVQTRELTLNPNAKHSGLLPDDAELLEAMDGRLKSGQGVLPVSFNKDGSFSKKSSVASPEEFERLRKQVERLTYETAHGIAKGCTDVVPLDLRESPCRWCEYRAACLFDEETDQRRPYERGVCNDDDA